jgi:hypothetical protein
MPGPRRTVKLLHWFVIRCGDSDLTVCRWNSEAANASGARHYCGEAHAAGELRKACRRHAGSRFAFKIWHNRVQQQNSALLSISHLTTSKRTR